MWLPVINEKEQIEQSLFKYNCWQYIIGWATATNSPWFSTLDYGFYNCCSQHHIFDSLPICIRSWVFGIIILYVKFNFLKTMMPLNVCQVSFLHQRVTKPVPNASGFIIKGSILARPAWCSIASTASTASCGPAEDEDDGKRWKEKFDLLPLLLPDPQRT